MLNALAQLGAHYADLAASLEQAGAGDSLYSRALANGVAGVACKQAWRRRLLTVPCARISPGRPASLQSCWTCTASLCCKWSGTCSTTPRRRCSLCSSSWQSSR